MIQLRYLKECVLQVSDKQKQPNGTVVEVFSDIETYKISFQELTDDVSASVYGANINKVCRITSPYKDLEKYLFDKVNNTDDNISKYYILFNNKRYKIISVKSSWIDIELI